MERVEVDNIVRAEEDTGETVELDHIVRTEEDTGERVQVDNIVQAEENTGHRKPQQKSEADHEHPSAGIDEDGGVDRIEEEEYPSVPRRTVIVVGVALALFCVGHQDSLDDDATLTRIL